MFGGDDVGDEGGELGSLDSAMKSTVTDKGCSELERTNSVMAADGWTNKEDCINLGML